RTHDSMPRQVLDQWVDERKKWLAARGIDAEDLDWQQKLAAIGKRSFDEFLKHFWNRWQDALDNCNGECVLRDHDLATIVKHSLLHFDRQRYFLLDFVVMPNHVHVLASFPGESAMLAQCESWKHFTANQINRKLGRKGRFWQQDGFDHLVRS